MSRTMIKTVVCLIGIAGCSDAPKPSVGENKALSYARLPTHWPLYCMGFYNQTNAQLEGVKLSWTNGETGYYCPAGRLSPGAEKDDCGAPDPIPAAGDVTWRTLDGIEHRQHVIIAGTVHNEPAFDGTIYLKISERGVTVVPLTQAETNARIDAGLKAIP